jgi:hypothetical protein
VVERAEDYASWSARGTSEGDRSEFNGHYPEVEYRSGKGRESSLSYGMPIDGARRTVRLPKLEVAGSTPSAAYKCRSCTGQAHREYLGFRRVPRWLL